MLNKQRCPFAGSVVVAALVSAAVLVSAPARAETPGCAAQGALGNGLPKHLLFGINSQTPDDTWAKDSGTKWDVQWLYLSGQAGNNWYNTWGGGAADGSFLDGMLSTIDGHGFIPGIHLYNMGYGHDGGDAGLLTEIQDKSWTKEYFTEFKVLLQRAKAFEKPVVVVIEGDSLGMVELLTQNDPTVMAAVASSELPELADLPDTIAGFGMAFLAMKKSVGAYNVLIGPDTPYYAANGDIMNFPPADMEDLQPHVDYQWQFFGTFVGDNQTGDRFDFMASSPDAADCAYYTDGHPCWDPSDDASVNSVSINRYVEWLHLLNQTSKLPWLLHQFPFGNSQNKNVPFDGSPRSGYKDNRAEYLLQFESPASVAIRDEHLGRFADAGVIGILFGSSDDGVTPSTDLWKDDQPFLSTHVAAVNNSGGFGIARGSGDCASSSGAGGTGGGATGGSSGANEGGQPDTTSSGGSTASGTGGTLSSTGGSSTGGRAAGGSSTGGRAPGGSSTGGSSTATGGTGISKGGAGTSSASGGAETGGATAGSAGAKAASAATSKDAGSCGCRVGDTSRGSWYQALGLAALVALARRRRSGSRGAGVA